MSGPGVGRYDVSFASSDGSTTVRGYAWWDHDPRDRTDERPKAVVLLVHGMAEHIERYDAFARWLACHGYLVCGHNQIGHGSSCPRERWGCLPAHGGAAYLVEDVERLRRLATSWCAPGTPCFVFGHSMGSFVARSYASHHGDAIDGAVICGTGFVDPRKARFGNALARLIARVRGDDAKSRFLHAMADGSYAKKVPARRTDFDWLSHNRANVDAYIADDACGFMFSAGGYATLMGITAEVCTPECARNVPPALPLLYISGAEDPVGDMGRGVTAAAELARKAGSTDVTVRLFQGMRHEILNEDDAPEVYRCVLAWLEQRLPGAREREDVA
ncbi:MAG: alpha/beta fold hydrolase [Parafannyhessea sp.]|uniref:alpha/beta fold hydrolase n=1 Tax=Parafannyhessea sp. TaxID=2847324 RepID=UPI003F03C24F